MTVESGSASIPPTTMPHAVEVDGPRCAGWLSRLFDVASLGNDVPQSCVVSDSGALLHYAVPGADELSDLELNRAVEQTYRRLLTELERRSLHPIRVWNYLPGILNTAERAQHRYMVFNAGRFAAYESFYGGAECFSACLPTASGTGTPTRNFVLQCYASTDPGEPLENGRQIPAYRYSQVYGDFPPCFTRATAVSTPQLGLPGPERRALLIGGTASIRGESSCHIGRLDLQLEETLTNLSALVAKGLGVADAARPAHLDCFVDLRVYHPRREDRTAIAQMVSEHFSHLTTLEFVQADLCRPELLVEIEGTAAQLPDAPAIAPNGR